jgi:hypothetical protein
MTPEQVDAVPFPSNGGVSTPKLRPSTPEALAIARANGIPDDMPWTTDPTSGLPAWYPPASPAQKRARRRGFREETGRAMNDAMASLVKVCGGEKQTAAWIKSVGRIELPDEPFAPDGLPWPSVERAKGQAYALLVEVRRQRKILDRIATMDDSEIPNMPVYDFGWKPKPAPVKPGAAYFPVVG